MPLTSMSGPDGRDPVGRATMRDVAALAGVSLKTVSRVVNREANVSPAVRAKVEHAAARLDYRHNLAASNLRKAHGRTGTLGALVQDISNSFSSSVLRGLENAARDRGLVLFAASLDEDPQRELDLVRDLVSRRVDGLVLAPSTPRQDYLGAEIRAGLPLIFLDRPPTGITADAVLIDNRHGALTATEHLLAHGHRRIALICDSPDLFTASGRIAGFKMAYAAHNLSPDPALLMTGIRDDVGAQRAVHTLLDLAEPPTAFFTARNVITVGAAREIVQRGLEQSVALVGFDDVPLADLLRPALTVVRQDTARIAAEVGRLLFERLDGSTAPAQQVLLRPSLITRGSGEIRPR